MSKGEAAVAGGWAPSRVVEEAAMSKAAARV